MAPVTKLAFEIGSIQPLITHTQYRINSHPVLRIRRSLAKLPNKKLGPNKKFDSLIYSNFVFDSESEWPITEH